MMKLMKKEEPLISVIVPVFNVEEYLPKCLDSILASTVENIEVLLIDDCSSDNSKAICKEYAKKDARIKFFGNAVHQGVCFSRNLGLDKAKGQYISFVDSDDYIAADMYEKMISAMEKENVSLVGCNAWNVDIDGKKQVIRYLHVAKNTVMSLQKAGNKIYQSSFHIWRLLYRKEILQNIRFYEVPFLEDALFLIELYPQIDRAYFLAEPLYFYCKHPQTYSTKCRSENFEIIKIKDFIAEIFAKSSLYDSFKQGFWRWYTFNLAHTYQLIPEELRGKYACAVQNVLPYNHYQVFLNRIKEYKHKYYLFGFLPFLTIERKRGKKYVKLFNVIPLYKVKDFSL